MNEGNAIINTHTSVIAFDIDGTLTNDVQIMKQCIQKWNTHVGYSSFDSVKYNPKKVSLVDFPPFMNETSFWQYTESIHKYPEIDAYTVNALMGIHNLGYTIILLTKRPIHISEKSGELPYTGTKDWLERNGVYFDHLICTNDSDKSPFLREYNCEYIVENDPHIFIDLRDHNCKSIPIMVRRSYNRTYENSIPNAIFINCIYDFYMMLIKDRQIIGRRI